MFGDINRGKCGCCVQGKATYTIINLLRDDSFSQTYKGTPGHVFNAFDGIFLYPCISLVFLLLAECHRKAMSKVPIIRHSCQFPNVQRHEWHSWKVDDNG